MWKEMVVAYFEALSDIYLKGRNPSIRIVVSRWRLPVQFRNTSQKLYLLS
jgi:hypothetical protein